MKACARIRFILLILAALFLLPSFSFAQTNVGDAAKDFVGGVIKEKFDKETGLNQIPDIKGINAGSIADDLVGGLIGDIPSPTMGQLTKEVRKLFRTYTTSKKYSVCERAANSRAWSSLRQIEEKAHFAPWADIAWTAIKSIANGGKTIGELIKENTEAELKKLLKDAIDSSPPAPEIKSLTFEGNCNSKSVTKWDPATKKITIIVTGNCGCERQVVGLSKPRLSAFEVRIEGLVESRVRLRQSPLWWLSPQPQIQYFVKKIRVITKADCNVCGSGDPPPPPKEKGFITGIFEWFGGLFDSSEEPEDLVNPPEDEDTEEEGDNEETDDADTDEETGDTAEEDLPEELKGIKAFIDKLLGRDKTDDPEDKVEETSKEEEANPKSEEPQDVTPKPLQCGDVTKVEGKNVQTFAYRETPNSDVNFACNNACSANQVCSVLPDSVGAFRNSCVYCKDIPKVVEEPVDEVSPVIKGGKCEAAIRFLLDEYEGWFDAPLTVSKNSAVFSNLQKCVDETEYTKYARQSRIDGVADKRVQAMCPTLKHVSSALTPSGVNCQDKTVFSF
ncbi:MAG: hypothetical protein JKX80_03020 [Candidatus Pacebacteria bacterium]|nr:hypothetical protein [Candidatus Paceibacterota bacterium]